MEMISLGDYTKAFYEKEKSFLEKNYPGISLNRIKSEIENVTLKDNVNPSTMFRESYIPDRDSDVTYFFEELKRGRPLEYISNKAYFYRSQFYVNEDVLIPRNETEILVEYAAEFARKNKCKNIIDIGTGSGAIILSFIQELDIPVNAWASDLSTQALEVAKRNEFLLRYKSPKETKVNFICTDRMKGIDQNFDIIMSNPPYIKETSDRHKVHGQVESFEPHMALYLTDDEYDTWFNDFFSQVESHLNNDGLFIMEGHEDHLQYQSEILKNYKFKNIEVIKDYTGRDRFLKGIKNG
jgi:release factor glutamine methyltransferase